MTTIYKHIEHRATEWDISRAIEVTRNPTGSVRVCLTAESERYDADSLHKDLSVHEASKLGVALMNLPDGCMDKNTIKGYDRHQFVKVSGMTYKVDPETDGRVSAYIALPMNTTSIMEESNILWWAKAHSEPEMWEDDEMYYRVYDVYLKHRYLLEMSDELRKVDGFYLRRDNEDVKYD